MKNCQSSAATWVFLASSATAATAAVWGPEISLTACRDNLRTVIRYKHRRQIVAISEVNLAIVASVLSFVKGNFTDL